MNKIKNNRKNKRFTPFSNKKKNSLKPVIKTKLHAVSIQLNYTILVYGTKEEVKDLVAEEVIGNHKCYDGYSEVIPSQFNRDGLLSNVSLSVKSKIAPINSISDLESRDDIRKYNNKSHVRICESAFEPDDNDQDESKKIEEIINLQEMK